jgi:hypothetical protein
MRASETKRPMKKVLDFGLVKLEDQRTITNPA